MMLILPSSIYVIYFPSVLPGNSQAGAAVRELREACLRKATMKARRDATQQREHFYSLTLGGQQRPMKLMKGLTVNGTNQQRRCESGGDAKLIFTSSRSDFWK